VALAYSGGLDTSIIIPWLRETYGCEVVAVAVDVGQREETAGLAEKAMASGASDFRLVDARDEFAADYLVPLLRAGAVYEREYLLGTAAARPVIARHQVRVARETACDALAHGCTGKGNDQVRFELAYRALAPDLRVIAPWREWGIRSREEAIDYAAARGIPVPVTRKDPYSRDRNLWHMSHEGGPLEDPAAPPEDHVWQLTVAPERAPAKPDDVRLGFEQGAPVSFDGDRLDPAALLERLNRLGGRHGVGRVDMVENRLIGIKSRGLYETPGGTILVAALRALESITLDRDAAHEKERLALRYADLVYAGQWFTPLREALDAFAATLARTVTGTVALRLYKGSARVIGRESACSLYSRGMASFDMDGYDARDAGGFIRLFALASAPARGASPEPTGVDPAAAEEEGMPAGAVGAATKADRASRTAAMGRRTP
jgi:argininosuccinate synthase